MKDDLLNIREIYERFFGEAAENDGEIQHFLSVYAQQVENLEDYVIDTYWSYLETTALPSIFVNYKDKNITKIVQDVIENFCLDETSMRDYNKCSLILEGYELIKDIYYVYFRNQIYILNEEISEDCDLYNCAYRLADIDSFNREIVYDTIIQEFEKQIQDV